MHKGFSIAGRVAYSANLFLKIKTVCLHVVIPEVQSFSMRPAKCFYDKPLPKYLDPKTVLIYRPHPVYEENCLFFFISVHRLAGWYDNPMPESTKNLASVFNQMHKVLTYVEYRAVSDVFQNIDPPSPPSVSSPRTKGRGYTLTGRRGGWGVNILEDASHRIGLLQ